MTQQNDGSIEQLVQGLFRSKEGLKDLLEILVNHTMQAEVSQHIGAGLHERSPNRRGYRNGTKPRTLKTRAGELSLSVPQTRGCEPYHPSMFHRWQRSERALLVACAEMYYQGVSTRRVQSVLEKMCGMDISSMTVSRVAAELDEKLDEFRDRRLDGHLYPYLLVDARYERIRINGHIVSQAVLVVAGYNEEGRREILDWRVEDSESEETWSQVFMDLKARGLRGVELITSDAHQGIRKAMVRHFQGVAWQRCRVHFRREVGRKVTPKYFPEVRRDIAAVFRSFERRECIRRGEEMARKWAKRFPRLSKMIREGLEDCLSVCDFPRTHHKRLKSTNVLERLMRELKRRTRVVSVFPNASSCHRLIGAQLIEMHEKWVTAQRPVFTWENVDVKAGRKEGRRTRIA